MMAVSALEEVHSAARIPKERSPPRWPVTSWRTLSSHEPERVAGKHLPERLEEAVQEVGDGQVAQQRGQEEEEGKQGEQEIVGELGGPAETVIVPDFGDHPPPQLGHA